MPTAELISFPGCPNVVEARSRLIRAFVEAGLTPRWSEYRTDAPDLPEHARGFGSPTILVDGKDVAGAVPTGGAAGACRLYTDRQGRRGGAPPLVSIVTALSAPATPAARRPAGRWRAILALLPGFGIALLPNLACPACWPAYAGVLGSLGLGFLIGTKWLLPITAIFLAVAVGALWYRAQERRGLRPFLLGLTAAGIVLAGKFTLESDLATYSGLAFLVTASIWNTWPVRGPSGASCLPCAPAGKGADCSQSAPTMEDFK